MSTSASFGGNYGSPVPDQYVIPQDPEELGVRLRQYLNTLGSTLNAKDTGYYFETQTLCGQKYYPTFVTGQSASAIPRDVIRLVVQTGMLATGANTVAHGITFPQNLPVPQPNTFHITRLYGVIESLAAPLYVAVPNDTVLLTMDDVNVNITIPAAYNGYAGQIVIEFVTLD